MTAGPLNRDQETVLVNCWCEAKQVRVSAADVKLGFTGPCKEEHCKRMDRRKRAEWKAAMRRVDL